MRRELVLVLAFVLSGYPTSEAASEEARLKLDLVGKLTPVEFAPLAKAEVAAMAAKSPSGELAKVLEDEGDAKVTSASVDLTNDKDYAIILRFIGLDSCGIRDCDTIAFIDKNGNFVRIWTGSSTTVAVGSEKFNGWLPIVTNADTSTGLGTIYIWKEGKYVLQ